MTRTDLVPYLPWIVLGIAAVVLAIVFRRRLGRLWRPLRQGIVWLYGHLLPVVAGFILLVASWTLLSGLIVNLDRLEALYLVGLMLVAAALCQYGNELLTRVKMWP
jgi:hypothetical protein